jgi:hypothetical protein
MTHVVRRIATVRTEDWRKPVRTELRRFSRRAYPMRLQGGARALQAEDHRPSNEPGEQVGR